MALSSLHASSSRGSTICRGRASMVEMADALTAYTALGSRAGGEVKTHGVAAAVMLKEVSPSAMIDLRRDPAEHMALNAVQRLLAFELPLTPGKASGNEQHVAWWFG